MKAIIIEAKLATNLIYREGIAKQTFAAAGGLYGGLICRINSYYLLDLLF